jgi:hypothetical protein
MIAAGIIENFDVLTNLVDEKVVQESSARAGDLR